MTPDKTVLNCTLSQHELTGFCIVRWAKPETMSRAGFYHDPTATNDDRSMCFTCNVCLVCWEKTDEPWSEHERHQPNCPFIKGVPTQNVPLSVYYASQPALKSRHKVCYDRTRLLVFSICCIKSYMDLRKTCCGPS